MVELRILSRAESGRVLHRETLALRSAPGATGLLPSQLQLLSDSDLWSSSDASLPLLFVAGPLVSDGACGQQDVACRVVCLFEYLRCT